MERSAGKTDAATTDAALREARGILDARFWILDEQPCVLRASPFILRTSSFSLRFPLLALRPSIPKPESDKSAVVEGVAVVVHRRGAQEVAHAHLVRGQRHVADSHHTVARPE